MTRLDDVFPRRRNETALTRGWGVRSRPPATDPASPDGAQPRRGSARVPRGPAIPAARARRPRRRAQNEPVRTLTRLGSVAVAILWAACSPAHLPVEVRPALATASVSRADRKSTRLNSSHSQISYAVFCLKKKNECRKIMNLSMKVELGLVTLMLQ